MLAVLRAGGRPVWLAPNRERPRSGLAGIVVTGGSDIAAQFYGGTDHAHAVPDVVRDRYEMAVLRFADLRGLPVLGICRGAQLINVYRGGNLYSDIANLRQVTSNRPSLLPSKTVTIEPDSRLRQIAAAATLRVNSLHHQAVRDLGGELRVVGRDDDGIVQAIESTAARTVIGVQWHPEYLQWQRPQLALFRALVEACERDGTARTNGDGA
ncbi:MAG: gamma-glutamyl-gamma-aminobutyrate hydrolase family protein [Pseudomonadota bacterium]